MDPIFPFLPPSLLENQTEIILIFLGDWWNHLPFFSSFHPPSPECVQKIGRSLKEEQMCDRRRRKRRRRRRRRRKWREKNCPLFFPR